MIKDFSNVPRYMFFDLHAFYEHQRGLVRQLIVGCHPEFAGCTPEWSFTFIDDWGNKCCVTPFWSRQSLSADLTQYELCNVTVFDQRESKYIRETAKRYFSHEPKDNIRRSVGIVS